MSAKDVIWRFLRWMSGHKKLSIRESSQPKSFQIMDRISRAQLRSPLGVGLICVISVVIIVVVSIVLHAIQGFLGIIAIAVLGWLAWRHQDRIRGWIENLRIGGATEEDVSGRETEEQASTLPRIDPRSSQSPERQREIATERELSRSLPARSTKEIPRV